MKSFVAREAGVTTRTTVGPGTTTRSEVRTSVKEGNGMLAIPGMVTENK